MKPKLVVIFVSIKIQTNLYLQFSLFVKYDTIQQCRICQDVKILLFTKHVYAVLTIVVIYLEMQYLCSLRSHHLSKAI